MKLELSQHLAEATSNGRKIESVIGGDLAEFAETWAAEYRDGAPRSAWEDVTSGRDALRRSVRREFIGYGLSAVAVVAGVAIAASGGERVENETWRWLWTGLAVVMGIGEIFTAGFFLLPFAIGAAAAADPGLAGGRPPGPVAGVLRSVAVCLHVPAPIHIPTG